MAVFSRRNGFNADDIQLECASDTLKRRIIAAFYKQEFDSYDTIDWTEYTTGIEDMMIERGVPYEFPNNEIVKKRNAEKLQKYMLDSDKWYIIYDFIERYLNILDKDTNDKMTLIFNNILEDEVSAYRILVGKVIPVINESELATIEEAKSTEFESVNTHINKAISLYADRRNPDYENSIKESINAVESLCWIITGLSGGNATLGKAIKQLKNKGIHIHSALETAFSSLYGYTSDENGIRHGGIDFTNAPSEDAKYMLVICSAFINYLFEKLSKIEGSDKDGKWGKKFSKNEY